MLASSGSPASSQSMAWRGTMTLRSGRSAKRITPSRSSRSASWNTPESVPSAIIALTSSSVTEEGASPRRPRSPSTASVEIRRNQTMGLPTAASTDIGPETKAAMPSALRSARRFGTSSPMISET